MAIEHAVQFVIAGMRPDDEMLPLVGWTKDETTSPYLNKRYQSLHTLAVSHETMGQLEADWRRLADKSPSMDGMDNYAALAHVKLPPDGDEFFEALVIVNWSYEGVETDVLGWRVGEDRWQLDCHKYGYEIPEGR